VKIELGHFRDYFFANQLPANPIIMELKDGIQTFYANTRKQWREWLQKNHVTEKSATAIQQQCTCFCQLAKICAFCKAGNIRMDTKCQTARHQTKKNRRNGAAGCR